nr:inactive protein kinase SELMODRAFT_444075-like [Tanacetum cinerariifolium]
MHECGLPDQKLANKLMHTEEVIRQSVERVVIVQDASQPINVLALRWLLTNLPLKQGDIMRLFRVVQPFMLDRNDHPPLPGCGLLSCFSMPLALSPSSSYNQRLNSLSFSGGSGKKLDSSATIQKKYETLEREIFDMQAEYQNNMEIKHITRLALSKQIDFDASAEAGTLKDFTLQAANDFGATYVILDRRDLNTRSKIIGAHASSCCPSLGMV